MARHGFLSFAAAVELCRAEQRDGVGAAIDFATEFDFLPCEEVGLELAAELGMPEAVRGALEVAKESGHPRAYEVAVAAMKHVADMTEKLQALHKNMKDLDEEKKGPSKVTNNAMFVGSTAELQKMLKDMGGGKR